MKVSEARQRISNITECIHTASLRLKNEKEPFYVANDECTIKMLEEYKEMLIKMIDEAELD